MNSILVPINSPINASGLNGKIDYQKQDYISLESDLRQEYQIMEGVINDKIGMWDFIHGGRGSTTGTLTYGGGLDSLYPEYSILAFVNSHGGASGLPSQMDATMKAFDGMWWLNPYEGAKQSAAYRTSSVTYGDYETKMNAGLDYVVGVEALLIAVMQWGNPLVGAEAIQRTSTWVTQRDALRAGIDGAEQFAINLKNLQAELNYYTDISSSAQLKSVLLGTGNEEGKYTLNTGLLASDMDYLTGTGTFANGTMSWNGGKEPLNMNKIAGKNGNPVIQERYVHDAYGLLVRDNGKNAGGTSATITGSSSGIKTATMTSADEFVSALAVLSQSQYEIERDEYFAAQEKYVGPGGQKADQKVILDAREQFYSDLLKKLSNNSGDNVEYDMYKKVVSDYMGQGAIIDQLFTLEQQQQYKQQTAVWDQKEEEFYKRKQEWVENIQFLQNAGLSKFNDMTNTILKGWDDWRTEFNKKAKDGEKQHLEQIATMITQKAAWEKEFISTYKDQTDTDKLAEAYRQIQGLIESYKKELPTDVGVELNANTILNKVLAGAPSKFDDNLINQGAYQDVQFFIDQVTTRKLDDSNIKQFQDLSKEMEERSQKLVVLQTLDGLYNIPKTYEEMIAAANKDLGKQLTQKVMQDGFLPVGDLLIRQTVGPDGNPQQQILPNYTVYGYEGPKQLPKVKDAQGKEWDLTNYNALAADGGPSTAELQQMVKLAITVLDKDFKKTYDPVNQENREEKIAMMDPVAMAKVIQASQGALRGLLSDPKYILANSEDKKVMEQSAMNSGYLVGPTEGGKFGDNHFTSFYTALKLKEKYDEMQAKGQELKSDGFANAIGDTVAFAVQITPLGYVVDTKALANTVTKAYHDNKDVVDAVTAVAAVVAAPFTGGASLIAYAAYKSVQGAYEGGVLGALAGAANVGNAYLQGLSGGTISYEMSYSYKEGFGVSVGGGIGKAGIGLGGSISWNERTGDISGSVGIQARMVSSGRITANLGINFDNTGITGASTGFGVGLGSNSKGSPLASLNAGISYDKNTGFGQSVGLSENTNKYTAQTSLDYSHTAWGGNTYSVTTPSAGGVTGTLSYNDQTKGYTASLNANGATALTYDSISGDSVYNKNFFGDVGKAKAMSVGGMSDKEYADYQTEQTQLRAQSQGLWNGTVGIAGLAWDGMKTAFNATIDGAVKVAETAFDIATFQKTDTAYYDVNGNKMVKTERFGGLWQTESGSLNGKVVNEVSVNERLGGLYRESKLNGEQIYDGDIIKRGADGKLIRIAGEDASSTNYGPGKALITQSGMDNNLIGNVDMHYSSRDELKNVMKIEGKGNYLPQESYHVFNDTGRFPGLNIFGELFNYATQYLTGGNIQTEPSVSTVQKMIEAGAVSNGGLIIGHSQGAQIVTDAIAGAKRNDRDLSISANVVLVGGAHNSLPEGLLSNGAKMLAFDNGDLIPKVPNLFIGNERIYNAQNGGGFGVVGFSDKGFEFGYSQPTYNSFENSNTFKRYSLPDTSSWNSAGHGYSSHYATGTPSGVLYWYATQAQTQCTYGGTSCTKSLFNNAGSR
ncbi:hypothetical protein [Leptospira sarikeiensis]|uniref:hypothetical protein n=1 Tax=Leptospira sarikeiensis TaxID=2484943 RepID=UPI001FE64A56|nr:hypothetical protein [Leptospira sarikeiensis]